MTKAEAETIQKVTFQLSLQDFNTYVHHFSNFIIYKKCCYLEKKPEKERSYKYLPANCNLLPEKEENVPKNEDDKPENENVPKKERRLTQKTENKNLEKADTEHIKHIKLN